MDNSKVARNDSMLRIGVALSDSKGSVLLFSDHFRFNLLNWHSLRHLVAQMILEEPRNHGIKVFFCRLE